MHQAETLLDLLHDLRAHCELRGEVMDEAWADGALRIVKRAVARAEALDDPLWEAVQSMLAAVDNLRSGIHSDLDWETVIERLRELSKARALVKQRLIASHPHLQLAKVTILLLGVNPKHKG